MITGHAYTLLDVVDLYSRGQVKHTLAKLRNPWGAESYHGKWSDKDFDSWTREWRKQVNLKRADDGIFYMPYDNFLNYYEWIAAAIYKVQGNT